MVEYIYEYSVKKATEGGQGTATFKRVFKNISKRIEGVRAGTYPSPYVGQTVIFIRAQTIEKMKKALKILVDYGYEDNLREAMKGIKEW